MKCIRCGKTVSGLVKAFDVNIADNILHIVCCAQCMSGVEIALNTSTAQAVEGEKPYTIIARIMRTIGGDTLLIHGG